jgi:hypothetical protein
VAGHYISPRNNVLNRVWCLDLFDAHTKMMSVKR